MLSSSTWRRTSSQVSAWLYCWCKPECSQLGHFQQRWTGNTMQVSLIRLFRDVLDRSVRPKYASCSTWKKKTVCANMSSGAHNKESKKATTKLQKSGERQRNARKRLSIRSCRHDVWKERAPTYYMGLIPSPCITRTDSTSSTGNKWQRIAEWPITVTHDDHNVDVSLYFRVWFFTTKLFFHNKLKLSTNPYETRSTRKSQTSVKRQVI